MNPAQLMDFSNSRLKRFDWRLRRWQETLTCTVHSLNLIHVKQIQIKYVLARQGQNYSQTLTNANVSQRYTTHIIRPHNTLFISDSVFLYNAFFSWLISFILLVCKRPSYKLSALLPPSSSLICPRTEESCASPAKPNERSDASALPAPAQHLHLILSEAEGLWALQHKAALTHPSNPWERKKKRRNKKTHNRLQRSRRADAGESPGLRPEKKEKKKKSVAFLLVWRLQIDNAARVFYFERRRELNPMMRLFAEGSRTAGPQSYRLDASRRSTAYQFRFRDTLRRRHLKHRVGPSRRRSRRVWREPS